MAIFSVSKICTVTFSMALVAQSARVVLSNKWVAEDEMILPGVENLGYTAPNGYTAAPLRWFGQASSDGPNITIVGRNIEQIFSKLTEINPNFPEFNEEQLNKQPKPTGLSKRQESVRFHDL
jgi:hypothetical protein